MSHPTILVIDDESSIRKLLRLTLEAVPYRVVEARDLRVAQQRQHITFTLDSSGSAGTFRSRILIDPTAEHGPPLAALDGRWSVADGIALTAITL